MHREPCGLGSQAQAQTVAPPPTSRAWGSAAVSSAKLFRQMKLRAAAPVSLLLLLFAQKGNKQKPTSLACAALLCAALRCTHLPPLDVRLQLLQSFQLLHLPLGLVDVGADGLHGLQGLLHRRVVGVLLGSPLQQFLFEEKERKKEGEDALVSRQVFNMK